MSYAFVQDVPANETMYRMIKSRLGDVAPDGLVAHLVLKREGGLRYVDVWENQADWERFRDEKVEPAVGEVLASFGVPHDHSLVSLQDVDVVDTWFGAGARA